MLVTLKSWAESHGIQPATARQRAIRGAFDSAVKVGRDWLIDESEELIDHREKGKSRRWQMGNKEQIMQEFEKPAPDYKKINELMKGMSSDELMELLDNINPELAEKIKQMAGE